MATTLEPGARLGIYEIVEKIGAGSEVYKASDPQFQRTVVIKVLTLQFFEHPETRQQVEREMQALAALNHPHICTLLDLGSENGIDYVVTEYLEGETLAERMKRGALDIDETLKIGVALADALDKAHRQGIIHRGLRPSNIMLTPDGPKLLDFALEKLKPQHGSADSSLSSLPTRTGDSVVSRMGAVAIQYTAPEQLEGKEADARTDIFAFGVVLYEMATGRKAFEGKTEPLLISAITTAEPQSLLKAQPMAPPALDHVIRRCLAKDPRQRLQTAWDLLGQLQWIAEGGSQLGAPAVVAAHRRRREQLTWAAAAVLFVLGFVLAVPAYRYLEGPPPGEQTQFLETAPGTGGSSGVGTPILSTFFISPDGRWLAMAVADLSAPTPLTGPTLVVRPVGSVTPQRLAFLGESGIPLQYFTFWSADSKSIAFFGDGKLKKVEVSGGPAQNICDAAAPSGGTWNSSGTIVFSSNNKLYRVLAAGGQPSEIAAPDASQHETSYRYPYFLPDGRHYLYQAVSSDAAKTAIFVGAIDSKEKTHVMESESEAAYAAPGYLLFTRGVTLFAQPFDAKKLSLTGEAVLVADQVSNNGAGLHEFSVSQSGVLAFRTSPGNPGNRGRGAVVNAVPDRPLNWLDRSGKHIESSMGMPGPYLGLDLSPDGKRVAVHRHEGEGGDIFVLEQGKAPVRLTFDVTQDNSSPVWSPDGKQIAFASRRNGKWGLYTKLADTTKEELILESDAQVSPMSWSPDGKFLLYRSATGSPQSSDQYIVALSGDKKPTPLLQGSFGEQNAQISPDGKWVAYSSNETANTNQIYIKPFPSGPGQWQVSFEGGFFPRWRHDSKELFFMNLAGGGNVMASDIKVEGASVTPGPPHILFSSAYANTGHPGLAVFSYNAYAVSADGQRFLIPQLAALAGGDDLADFMGQIADRGGLPALIASGGAAGANPAVPVTVVLNWPTILKRK